MRAQSASRRQFNANKDLQEPQVCKVTYAVLSKVLVPILCGGQHKFFLICTVFEFGLYEYGVWGSVVVKALCY